MKQGPVTSLSVRRNAILRVLITLIVGTQIACVSKQTAPAQASNQRAAEARAATTSDVPNKTPQCPTFNSFSEPARPAKVEHIEHRVILSWTASVTDAKHPVPYGYCAYRVATKPNKGSPASAKPDTGLLVRVNIEPFQGTRCTDDRVPTGNIYYYKVKAISLDGRLSEATDFATASVLDPKPSKPSGTPPPRVCRGPNDN
jgi:hypothetical protein